MENHKIQRAAGAAVALASCAAMFAAAALAPTASAVGPYTDDEFKAGTLDPSKSVSLSLTKYKSTTKGSDPTGAASDINNISGETPLQGVDFNLYKITSACEPSSLVLDKETNAGKDIAPSVKCGTADATLSLVSKQTTDGSGKAKWDLGTFAEVGYYVLQETSTPAGVTVSQNTLFGLPYYTVVDDTPGYVYNVSVFPKNVSSNQINKSVDGPLVAQVGDELTFTLEEKVYKGATPKGTTGVAKDGYLTLDEIDTSKSPQLRVVDRLSSALELTAWNYESKTWSGAKPTVDWSCIGSTGGTLTDSQYSVNYPDKRHSSIFTDDGDADGNTYLTFEFFGSSVPDFSTCESDVTLTTSFSAKVTGEGAGDAGTPGTLSNSADTEVLGDDPANPDTPVPNPDQPAIVTVPAAGLNFAKTDKDIKAVPGAVFRLASPTDKTKFLTTTGDFSDDKSKDYIEATSNAKGIVTFTALPLYTSGTTVGESTTPNTTWLNGTGTLSLIEFSTPDEYALPSVEFKTVDFSDLKGSAAKDLAAKGQLTPDFDSLKFGSYEVTDTTKLATFTDNTGTAVKKGLINFTSDDAPISLPLTGGQGVVIFLILGAAVMGVTLYVSHRRNKANVTA